MNTLHVFAIGGTGSRVLRALTMLLASGIECKMDIHPIIIDPDQSNSDMNRTCELLRKYSALHSGLSFDSSTKNKFFKTDIQVTSALNLPLAKSNNKIFKDYLGISSMSESSQAMLRGLYSDEDLNADMEVGFEGHPNRGSMVLAQIATTQAFDDFATQFKQGDRVFIISSIFGGTGAAGFPLLLNTLRSNNRIPNFKLINDAEIGAVTVLPYFKVKSDDNSPIDSSTFISKARSALHYYKRNISDLNKLETLYYIGDNGGNTYDNNKGGRNQRNNAHFVEMASALAIVDFAASQFNNNQGERRTIHKEFGIINAGSSIVFKDLGDTTKKMLVTNMIQMMLLYQLFYNHYEEMAKRQYILDHGNNFLKDDFVVKFRDFLNEYKVWNDEMSNNSISFAPFDLTKICDIVCGYKYDRRFYQRKGFDRFDDEIASQKSSSAHKPQQILMDKLYEATSIMAQSDYK